MSISERSGKMSERERERENAKEKKTELEKKQTPLAFLCNFD